MKLVKIALPSFYSQETLHMVILSIMLVIRTFLSMYLAAINGGLVKSIVELDL